VACGVVPVAATLTLVGGAVVVGAWVGVAAVGVVGGVALSVAVAAASSRALIAPVAPTTTTAGAAVEGAV